jgi:predicted cupin superfamily sugar epimerase
MTAPPSTAAEWARSLRLHRHLEGGWYAETYRADLRLPAEALPAAYDGPRPAATSILFLLARGDVSRLHRLRSDEQWYFHVGEPLALHVFGPEGEYGRWLLGPDSADGPTFQAVVPAGSWFGAETTGEYSLVSCVVAPGFDFADFELARRAELVEAYPAQAEVIERMTRG